MLLRSGITAAAVGAMLAASAMAQQGVNEIGFSAGIQADFAGGEEQVTIAVPGGTFRWGVFWDDQNSLELGLGVRWIDVGDSGDVVASIGASILHHFERDFMAPRPYVALGGGWSYVEAGGFSGDQFGIGGAVGYAIPINEGAGARFTAGYTYSIENDDFADAHSVFGSIGISAFIGRDRVPRRGR